MTQLDLSPAELTAFESEFGIAPTPLRQALASTIEWYAGALASQAAA